MTAGYKATEAGLIPEDWVVRPLGQICPMQRGFDLPRKRIRPGDFPIVYSNGALGTHNRAMVNGPGIVTGRSGTIGNIHFVDRDFWPHNTALWVTSFCGNDPAFVRYLLEMVDLGSLATGSGVPTLNRNDIHPVQVAIPPNIAEQSAVAEALMDLDAAIMAAKAVIAKKRALKTATMKALLSGARRLPGHSEEWGTATLREMSDFITKGATPTTYGFSWQSSGVLFLRSECVSETGLDLAQSMFISHAAHRMMQRSAVIDGDLLVTITGNVGRVVRYSGPEPANLNQHIARVRITSAEAHPDFVYHYLAQPEIRRHYGQITTGQAYPQLSLVQVRNTVVSLPSYEEQREIADVLSDMDNEIATLEAEFAKLRLIKTGVMQQLLTGKIRLL